MDPDQFVIFIQMMDAIRCQIGALKAISSTDDMDYELHKLAAHLAEEARNNAQYQATKASRVATEKQRRA